DGGCREGGGGGSSGDAFHDAAFHAQRRTGGGAGLRGCDVDAHAGHFLRAPDGAAVVQSKRNAEMVVSMIFSENTLRPSESAPAPAATSSGMRCSSPPGGWQRRACGACVQSASSASRPAGALSTVAVNQSSN